MLELLAQGWYILVGILLFFFSLTITGTACYVRCLNDCE